MSKTIESNVLYGNVDIQIPNVPSNYDEGDALVGEIGGVLQGFISDCLARNYLPRLYGKVSEKLVAQGHAKVKIGTRTSGEGDKAKTVDTFETDIKHLGRLYDTGDQAMKDSIATLLQDEAKTLPFYEKGDRSGAGKISNAAMDASNSFFAQGVDTVESKASKIEAYLGNGYKVIRDSDGAVTPEGLARALMAMNKEVVRRTMDAALA